MLNCDRIQTSCATATAETSRVNTCEFLLVIKLLQFMLKVQNLQNIFDAAVVVIEICTGAEMQWCI